MSIGELSDAFGLDASTLNRQTAAAMRAGLLERIPDPDGGMARKFRITDEGARMLDEEREGIVRSLDQVMDELVGRGHRGLRLLPEALQHRHRAPRRTPLAPPLTRRDRCPARWTPTR